MNREPAQSAPALPVQTRRARARLARARLVAWLIDLACISGFVAVLAVVGVALYSAGALPALSAGPGNALSFLVLIVPVTLALAWFESGSRWATVGKQARALRVVDEGTGSRISFRRALVRNTLKLTLPWEIGHTVVYGFVGTSGGGALPGWLIATTVLAYLLPAVYVVSLFVGSGRAPYDRIARTAVVRAN